MFESVTMSEVLRLLAAVVLTVGSVELARYALRMRRARVEARTALIEPWTHSKRPDAARPAEADTDARTERALTKEQREFMWRLRRLGIRPRFVPAAYLATRIAGALGLALAAWFVAPHLVSTAKSSLVPFFLAGGAGALGWYIPALAAHFAAKHRAEVVVAGLPDALELLVICAEGGLSLGDGIDRIVKQLERSQPELAAELALTAADLKILPDQDQALTRLADRIDAPMIQSVATALVQTMQYGTPLAQAVRTMAAEIRDDALVHLEERANALPTILTVPMILFILPTIILIIGGPAVLKLMDTL